MNLINTVSKFHLGAIQLQYKVIYARFEIVKINRATPPQNDLLRLPYLQKTTQTMSACP